jgi:hypothetical protein
MMSQRWASRSKSDVVIVASPKTLLHSPNDRFVVTISETRGLSGLPDAEEPDQFEAVVRDLVQLRIAHVVELGGTSERGG